MLSVWSFTRFRVLQLPVRPACSGVIHRRTPGHTCCAPPSLNGLHRSGGCRLLSGVSSSSSGDAAGVAGAPGVAGVAGTGGWYSSLSDSAPVHLCEDFLLSLQEVSGFPWWLSIVVATLSVRTLVTLPLACYQQVIISKVELLQVEIAAQANRLRFEISVIAKARGWTEKQSRSEFHKSLTRIIAQLHIRENCHPMKASLLIWVQVPLWISLSLALRNLSLDQSGRQAELAAGGALWFPDLTAPDPTWILPICLGLTNLMIVEVFSLQKADRSRFQRLVQNAFRGFSVLMIPLAAAVPSSMALYWFTSSLVGLSHNLLLRSPSVHRILRLQNRRSETPYRDLLSAFKAKYLP